jgi:hypothetical protein
LAAILAATVDSQGLSRLPAAVEGRSASSGAGPGSVVCPIVFLER